MESLTLPDGRPVQLRLGGVGTGPVVMFFHGTPDTRWAARSGDEAAREVGVRLLCVNRPGHGLSARADSTYSTVADDAAAVLDLLGIGEVAALGMSVGGGYAATFAVRHPGRTTALGVVATLLFRPWGVDVASASCPVHLWYGERDGRALPGAAWLAERVPHAEVVVRPGSTHLATLLEHWPEILADLTRG